MPFLFINFLVSVSGISTSPFVGKNTIELALPTALPTKCCGSECFFLNESELEEGGNKLIEMQKADVSERLLPLNMAPLTGLEPVTYGLTVRRSTD
jgi:hypothetical protein